MAARPLVVTADEQVLDDVIRVASSCGLAMDVAPDVGAARQTWARAPMVLVGADLAGPMLRSAPARRDGVVVVGCAEQPFDWPGAVRLGVEEVVLLPDHEPRLAELLAEAADGGRSAAVVVGVLGGRGGAGASVLSVALAVSAVKAGRRCALIDGDRLGGGLDAILGAEDHAGARWPDLVGAEGRVPAGALQSVLPCVGGIHLLSWDRGDPQPLPPAAMRAVLGAAGRLADLVVVDLPRHVDEATEAALGLCTVVLLVVPAEVRAVTSAARVVPAITPYAPEVRLVVRNPSPGGLSGPAVADLLGLPLAGELPPERGLAAALDQGQPPGRSPRSPLGRWCRRYVSELNLPRSEAA